MRFGIERVLDEGIRLGFSVSCRGDACIDRHIVYPPINFFPLSEFYLIVYELTSLKTELVKKFSSSVAYLQDNPLFLLYEQLI